MSSVITRRSRSAAEILPPARAVAAFSRWGVQLVAVAMGLEQLGIAEHIVVVGFGITLGGVILAGAIAKARLRARYPAPGRLIDVGGRRMHLRCEGSGEPAVVFIAHLDEVGFSVTGIREDVTIGAHIVTLEVTMTNQDGAVMAKGPAEVQLPDP